MGLGLLAGLLALGISQSRDRTASLTRVSLLPLVMTIVPVSGTFSAWHATPHRALSFLAWIIVAAVAFAFTFHAREPNAAKHDPAQSLYFMPGSVGPMVLIVGIFLVKYVVGVDIAMSPQLLQQAQCALSVAALYGAFTGVFLGRASRLWRMALRPATAIASA